MSAVNAVQKAVKHGLKPIQHAAKTARIIYDHTPKQAHHSVDTVSDASLTKHERRYSLTIASHAVNDTSAGPPSIPHDHKHLSRPILNTNAPKPLQRQPPLLNFIHERHPNPMNCTTLLPTRLFATDPSHPLHNRTQRRLAAFNPSRLTWRVQVPVAVSKKPAIRREAEKRVKNAFRAELREAGFGEDGSKLSEGQSSAENDGIKAMDRVRNSVVEPPTGNEGIKGALLMIMNKDPIRSLRFRSEEVREEIRRWVGRTLKERDGVGMDNGRRDDFRRLHMKKNYMPRRDDSGNVTSMSLKDGMLKRGDIFSNG